MALDGLLPKYLIFVERVARPLVRMAYYQAINVQPPHSCVPFCYGDFKTKQNMGCNAEFNSASAGSLSGTDPSTIPGLKRGDRAKFLYGKSIKILICVCLITS